MYLGARTSGSARGSHERLGLIADDDPINRRDAIATTRLGKVQGLVRDAQKRDPICPVGGDHGHAGRGGEPTGHTRPWNIQFGVAGYIRRRAPTPTRPCRVSSLPGMLGDKRLTIGGLGDNGRRARNREVVLPECRSILRP